MRTVFWACGKSLSLAHLIQSVWECGLVDIPAEGVQ
jgi:hypothetical protein